MVVAEEKVPFTFLNEWQLLFSGDKIDDVKIQKYCINGCLSNSHIRSLTWRIVLKILPLRRSEWKKALRKSRENYGELSVKLNFDPRTSVDTVDDPNVINPLFENRTNPWCLYFEDKKLREVIFKDVERTSPDLPFFQSKQIRDLMVNILFTYSKSHPQISYRQGMHELLAPIIFVLDLDQKVYAQLKEQNCLSFTSQAGFSYDDIQLLQIINDSRFLEHDAYTIFCQLMMLVECFYLTKNETDAAGNADIRSRAHSTAAVFRHHLERMPFSNVQREQDLSTIHKRLEVIHDELLMTIDPPLARHLSSLQILPQVYGIRWLRLLFGREFSILDLLTIWDVIFADQSNQSMIDYVFIGLLVQIRHFLLHGDYSTCMHYLMKYPPVADVNVFIRFVLFLKYPQRYPIPDAMSSFALYVNPGRSSARSEWIWAKNSITPPFKDTKQSRQRKADKTQALDSVLNKIGRQALAAYPAKFHSGGKRKEKQSHQSTTSEDSSSSERNLSSATQNSADARIKSINSTARSSPHHNGEIELMKEQISLLQSRLNDVDFIGQISARKIRACADEKRMQTPEARRKLMEELNEIAEQLTRSTISEQYIMQNVQPPPATPNGTKGEAVELAAEVLGFQSASSSSVPAPISRARLSSKTLPDANNEMIELRFDKKKNF